jgi:group I intron endonuclease
MIGIYKITSPSNKVYIGQSVNIERRFLDYKKSLKKQQIKLFNSIKKYGYENHIFEVIEECSIELLNERERYWQEYYNCVEDGLNCRYTKTDDKSGSLSKETINKLKNKNVDYLKGNSFRTGIKHSEEIKQQIRNTLIENSKKDNYFNGMTGKFGSLNPFYGKKHSKETILKIKETYKKNFKENKFKKGFILIDLSTGIFYNSIGEASFCLCINKSSLKAMLSGKFKNKTNLIKI